MVDIREQKVFPTLDVTTWVLRIATGNPIRLTSLPEFGAVGLWPAVNLTPNVSAYRRTKVAAHVDLWSTLWTFNAFTTQAVSGGTWTFIDSLGAGGPSPAGPQFVSPRLCMTEPFDNTYFGIYVPSDPAAEISSVEISNNPVSPTPCP